MDKQEMYEKLSARGIELAKKLREIESEFNLKKEEFLKIQGALEALQELQD